MHHSSWYTGGHYTLRMLLCTHNAAIDGLYDFLMEDPVEGKRHLEAMRKDGRNVLPLIDKVFKRNGLSKVSLVEQWPRNLDIEFLTFPEDDEWKSDIIVTDTKVYLPWNVKLVTVHERDTQDRLRNFREMAERKKSRSFPFLNDPSWCGSPLTKADVPTPFFLYAYGFGKVISHVQAIIEYKRSGQTGDPPEHMDLYNSTDIENFVTAIFDGSVTERHKYIHRSVGVEIGPDIFEFARFEGEESKLSILFPGRYLTATELTSSRLSSGSGSDADRTLGTLSECTGDCHNFWENADTRF